MLTFAQLVTINFARNHIRNLVPFQKLHEYVAHIVCCVCESMRPDIARVRLTAVPAIGSCPSA